MTRVLTLGKDAYEGEEPDDQTIYALDGDDDFLLYIHYDRDPHDFYVEAGKGNDHINGAAGADTLDGGEGNDSLYGFQGNDLLLGGLGNDHLADQEGHNQLHGGAGDDSLSGGAGDLLDGGLGNDTYLVDRSPVVIFEGPGEGFDVVEANSDFQLQSGAGVERLLAYARPPDDIAAGFSDQSISLTGNEQAQELIGNRSTNSLSGLGGNDVILGNDGNDVLRGGEGADLCDGGLGDDALYSEAGADVLQGADGDDRLSGGAHNDVLSGGSGKDVFVFDAKLGSAKTDRKVNFDRIGDFSVRDDSLWLDDRIFKARDLKKLAKGASELKPKVLKKAFFSLEKAKDKDDYLIYNRKTGVLSYDPDGSGGKQAIEFARLDKKLKLTHKDFFMV